MRFTVETEITDDFSILIACLRKIGVRVSHSVERGRLSLLRGKDRIELFLEGIERIEMIGEEVTIFLYSGKTVTASPCGIRGESMPRPKREKDLLSYNEAAALLGIDRTTIWRWIQAGRLNPIGKKIKKEEALNAWKESKILQFYEREKEISERTGEKMLKKYATKEEILDAK